MTIKYSLTEDDYLQHQLYVASKSDRIKRRREQSWFIVTFACIALTFLFSQLNNKVMIYCSAAFSIFTLLFYPVYLRNHYKEHYQKYIADTYKNRIGETSTITFDDRNQNLEMYDSISELKLNYQAFEEVVEIKDHFLLRVKTGETVIIPKKKVENVDSIKSTLEQFANKLAINYSYEKDWKWR